MNSAQPVSQAQRIVSLDVLRGVALLGILTMNIGAFSMPAAAYFDPTAHGDLGGADGLVWGFAHALFDLKFMAIFSMLFGAGIVLMSQRQEVKGQPAAGLHYRRMFWLLVFGLLHAYLLWWGDILVWYSACGLVVYLFRRLGPRRLIVLGLLSIALPSALQLFSVATFEHWPAEAREQVVRDMKPAAETKAKEIADYRGGWLEQMQSRVPKAAEMHTAAFLTWAMWRVGGLMLLGMALFKLGVFGAERSRRFYQALVVAAVVLGLPAIAYGIRFNFSIDWRAPDYFFLGLQWNYWASLLVALGWVGVVILLFQKLGLSRWTRPLAAVGQTAFTNYILQTVICTSIFYGHGLGLFGRVDRVGQVGVVLAVWTLQLIASVWWLRRFRFGPLEWLWRSLVYLQPQPFRRG